MRNWEAKLDDAALVSYFSLTPNILGPPFGCRSEALTEAFLLTLAARRFLEPEKSRSRLFGRRSI
jgi:hypothetical protein